MSINFLIKVFILSTYIISILGIQSFFNIEHISLTILFLGFHPLKFISKTKIKISIHQYLSRIQYIANGVYQIAQFLVWVLNKFYSFIHAGTLQQTEVSKSTLNKDFDQHCLIINQYYKEKCLVSRAQHYTQWNSHTGSVVSHSTSRTACVIVPHKNSLDSANRLSNE